MDGRSGRVRVLVVDDHPLFREGLTAAVTLAPEFALVGQASTGEEAIAAVAALAPDLVLMDLGLPGMSGIEATRRITADHPGTHVLVITMSEDDDSLLAAIRAGARGHVLKGARRDEVLHALRVAARGGAVFSPGMAARLAALVQGPATAPARQAFPSLTPRELEVLDLLARGATYRQIAARLVVSDKTVRNHVGAIFSKLQVNDRAGAIVRARDAGLGASRC
ncbi:response regulator [Actinomadura litoris]|uniref:response regulator n=1 Tax=Actinomadura litoris TaxID=2678616 RepID=UPI001FA7DC9D|nr:response regulator transcription factor [Actinomadura litoris]